MFDEGFPGSPVVKNLPEIQEPQKMQIQSLGWEDPLEKEMAATPVFLPGESLTEEPGGLQSIRSQRVGHN